MATKYNVTQLDPLKEFERHIFHRDQFAHYLRWTHVLKVAKIGQRILDLGCGTGNLLEVLYRNKFRPSAYLGLDIRRKIIKGCQDRWGTLDFASFKVADLCGDLSTLGLGDDWDIITSFEVIEHLGKQNVAKFLANVKACSNENTMVLISTPVYDQKVGAAANHIIEGERGELTFDELKDVIEQQLKIEAVFGTFASVKDYKPFLRPGSWQLQMYEHLTRYYDSNLVSNLMAPLFPRQSRNCLWRLSARKQAREDEKKTSLF
jgi:SAM-dependent methyltransferase